MTNEIEIWINPYGGLGDMLMLSGVLKLCYDQNPDRKYCMVRRTRYREFFDGHPAIGRFGNPALEQEVIVSNYWDKEEEGQGIQRPFQILARTFGLETPVEEQLFFPKPLLENGILLKQIPFVKEKTVVIAPYSDSPRKMLPLTTWEAVVKALKGKGYFIIQVGQRENKYIKGAYSVCGCGINPHQLISLIDKCNYVITLDNFIMHIAHLLKKPAVVLWGPTVPEVFGYEEQCHIRASIEQRTCAGKCIGRGLYLGRGFYYKTCPETVHCMDKISEKTILEEFNKITIV